MITGLKNELLKMKHRHFPLLILGFLILVFIWCSFTLSDPKTLDVTSGYFDLLYQIPIMNTVLLPLYIAVLASRIWDCEYKGCTMKLLATLQKKNSIFFLKSLIGAVILIIISIGEYVVIRLLGSVYQFTQVIPQTHLICLMVCTLITSMVLYLIQEIISIMFENQVPSLAFGLIGSFVGFFSCFFGRSIQQFVIWSYYSLLQTVGMRWDKTTRVCSFYEIPLSLKHFFLVIIILFLIYPLGRYLFERKDV